MINLLKLGKEAVLISYYSKKLCKNITLYEGEIITKLEFESNQRFILAQIKQSIKIIEKEVRI